MMPDYGLTSDGAYSSKTKLGDRQVVEAGSNRTLFRVLDVPNTTINHQEFLGVIDCMKLILDSSQALSIRSKVIWTDSITAMAWVRNGKVKSNLHSDEVDEALVWLEKNRKRIKVAGIVVKKWQTRIWGEIPSDFGRK